MGYLLAWIVSDTIKLVLTFTSSVYCILMILSPCAVQGKRPAQYVGLASMAFYFLLFLYCHGAVYSSWQSYQVLFSIHNIFLAWAVSITSYRFHEARYKTVKLKSKFPPYYWRNYKIISALFTFVHTIGLISSLATNRYKLNALRLFNSGVFIVALTYYVVRSNVHLKRVIRKSIDMSMSRIDIAGVGSNIASRLQTLASSRKTNGMSIDDSKGVVDAVDLKQINKSSSSPRLIKDIRSKQTIVANLRRVIWMWAIIGGAMATLVFYWGVSASLSGMKVSEVYQNEIEKYALGDDIGYYIIFIGTYIVIHMNRVPIKPFNPPTTQKHSRIA
mmetsp:Transcript_26790/g.37078  ORF Transcript_26790/g.37078 Transcript_26790/m.37078 type:complete len:331 (-) Transcript_26790:80-1072(-)